MTILAGNRTKGKFRLCLWLWVSFGAFTFARCTRDLDKLTPEIRAVQGYGKTVYLLGTIHGAHSRNPDYSWPHLQKILSLTAPDLLLVEIRPEHFSPDEYYSDGPLEMAYLVYLASRRKIDCRGIDWWPDEWLYHSDRRDWQRRNDRMFERVVDALQKSRAKVVLIAVGVAHISPFMRRFVRNGYVQVATPPWDLTVAEYPDLPREVIEMWQKGADYLARQPIARSRRIKKKIELWRDVVKHRGYKFDTRIRKRKMELSEESCAS